MALTIIGGKDAHGLRDLGEFMADRIEFDRDAVGVSAKADWEDADTFAKIGSFMSSMPSGDGVAVALPSGSNVGTSSLKFALNEYQSTMRRVVLEYSDACAILGSGQEEMISDMDRTEYQHVSNLDALAARMGGCE